VLITTEKGETSVMKFIFISIKKLFKLVGLEVYSKGLGGGDNGIWLMNRIYQEGD
jgi:hypothetical protein